MRSRVESNSRRTRTLADVETGAPSDEAATSLVAPFEAQDTGIARGMGAAAPFAVAVAVAGSADPAAAVVAAATAAGAAGSCANTMSWKGELTIGTGLGLVGGCATGVWPCAPIEGRRSGTRPRVMSA